MMFERSSPARGFMTPPPPQALSWKTRPSSSCCSSRSSPNMLLTHSAERKRSSPAASVNKGDLFHVIHKVPAGDSPYVKAKQVQLVDKDPARSISMFWAAINAGDRVESALKDMALVMKQLNRSDEAIEAIKSFRHLCPSESQESLDNILVELYKRSGRADEEISMLHHKLKQIEDGVTFVGRTTKQARSQGKKIQITAEQEISRILGNLAWAYLQKGDYKTAEEHYRKALSFEVDRNKQCNLAICLMQMNRITEAKFLLQAVSTASKNRKMDDSFAKSFERASQMLSEIESSSAGRSMSQCSPQSSPAGELKKGTSIGNSSGRHSDIVKSRTENWSLTSEVEVSRARRRLYESPDPARRDTKVPYTKPKRPSWGFNNNGCQRETWGDIHSDPKPSFGSPASDKYGIVLPKSTGRNDLSSSPANGKWRAKTLEDAADDSNWRSKPSESHHMTLDGAKDSVATKSVGNNMSSGNLVNLNEFTASGYGRLLAKKSWADIVEEEENEEHVDLFSGGYAGFHGQDSEEVFNDENVNLNIISQHPGNATLSRNPTIRRSLCFNPELTTESACKASNLESCRILSNQHARRSLCFNPELTTESACKASNLESCRILSNQSDSFSGEKNLTRRNRLQVFQDITLQPETP